MSHNIKILTSGAHDLLPHLNSPLAMQDAMMDPE